MTGGAAFCVALAAAAFQADPVVGDGDVVPSVVVLLAGRETEPLAGRLAAELAGVGLEVRREDAVDDVAPDPVATAQRLRARAAIWVPAGTASAEVWIIDRDSGRTTIRQSITAEGDEMAPLVAMRTVEFLRASLLGLKPAAAEPTPRPPPLTQPAESLRAGGPPPDLGPTPTGPRVTVAVGAGLTASPGGFGPLPSIAAAVRAPLHGALGVEALGLLSVSPAHVRSFSLTASLAGAGLTLRLLGSRRASIDAGAGVMAAFLHTVANDATTYMDLSWGDTLAALYGRLGAGLAFTPWLGMRAEALVGGVFQRPMLKVMQTEEPIGSWGRPFGTAILDLEARWR